MKISRPAAVAGMLLGVAACTKAQALHTVAEPMLVATALPATASFAELAHESSPFAAYSSSTVAENTAEAELPEAPSAQILKEKKQDPRIPAVPAAAGRAINHPGRPAVSQYEKYIPAGYVTHPQTVHEKVITGARDLYSPGTIAGWFISSGWSHLINSSPNYGTDKGAYGERLGAAALRSTSQGVLTDMVFAPLLHQDLRYYVKGPRYNVVQRTLYAASRVLIARRDTTSTTVNTAELAGYLGTAAMTQIYYPSVNRGWDNFASSFGSSLGGAMLTNIFNEFRPDILMVAHLKHKSYEPFKDNDPRN
ncbi:hypothetical protein ACFQBQ_13275 [Granulicella cerasi]|uniref:Lipoprotein n=1 Tax=Granulicella cerasi TaxID=741063 RepID=A0ABW1ZCW8_9BACT|nr:hypothetical protein [Granulicella cerasi]